MSVPMINHRGPAFAELISECREGLKWAFQTQNEVVVFPASGTGGLEAAVQNMTSPGEKALFVTIGSFGDRFAKIGEAYGADVVKVDYEWGHGAVAAEVAETGSTSTPRSGSSSSPTTRPRPGSPTTSPTSPGWSRSAAG